MRTQRGTIHGIQVSDGGVPKLGVAEAAVDGSGVAGDRQRDLEYHGGPDRAVCLLGLDVIERLAADGHPIAPGTTGENVTIAGIDWAKVGVGTRFLFEDGTQVEATAYAAPCRNIEASFRDADFSVMSERRCPENARLYARVVSAGVLRVGATVAVISASGSD